MSLTLAGSARVVAVVAHPDDAELMFYGTLRRWRACGAQVTVVIVTHGMNGVSLPDRSAGLRLEVADRSTESDQAYAGTGIAVECLALEDGALSADRRLVSAIEAALTRRGCTVLLTHAPSAGNDHQDHHAVGLAALNAATRVPTCTGILHGQPHAPHNGFTPTVLVEITEFLDDKIAALSRHESQAGRYYLRGDYTRWRAAGAAWNAVPARAIAGRYFEALAPSLLLVEDAPDPQGSPRLDEERCRPCST